MSTRKPYKFYTKNLNDGRIKTIAVSTYAGRTVRGSAICDANDQYVEGVGQSIAASRCGVKIAKKRLQRAQQKRDEALRMVTEASKYFLKMNDYYNDACKAMAKANEEASVTY